MKKVYVCPINDWECPYYDANGNCMIDNPRMDCDDYVAILGDETED